MASVLRSLPGLFATLIVSASAFAQQDPDQLFKEGVDLLRLNKPAEALAKFEAVLVADPSNADAFRIWRSTDQAVFQMLLLDKGEISKIAKHIVSMARLERRQRSRDIAKIDALVQQATAADGNYDSRRRASLSLMADHGEFAVPALVAKLANADDEKGQIYAIRTLADIGRSVTLPLVQALRSDKIEVRRNAAAALALIKDDRAAADLLRLTADNRENESVRLAASKALAEIGIAAGSSPVALYLRDVRRYLSADGVSDGDFSDVVWSWQDGKLVHADVPAVIYNFELAKNAAHAAVELAPGNDAARTLLVRAYLGEVAAIKDSATAKPDDETLSNLAARTGALEMVAAAAGPDILRRAIVASIADGMTATAVTAIGMLGRIEDRTSLADSPLVAVLDHPDKRLGYAAALALSGAAGGGPVPAAGKVVKRLASAVSEEAIRVVKVIDPSPIAAKAVAEASGRRGMEINISNAGMSAINELFSFPNVDVVVVNESLPDARTEAIVGLIRKDARFARVKILVVAQDPDKASARFGEKIDHVIKGPLSGAALRKAIDEALADVEMAPIKARADKVAVAASQALGSLAADRVDIQSALTNLGAQLDRADAVAIPAARALGFGGNGATLGLLVNVIKGAAASLDLKVASSKAVGRILARLPQTPAGTFTALLAVLGGGADARLQAAIVEALGKGKLQSAQRLRLIETLRVTPASSGGGSEG